MSFLSLGTSNMKCLAYFFSSRLINELIMETNLAQRFLLKDELRKLHLNHLRKKASSSSFLCILIVVAHDG